MHPQRMGVADVCQRLTHRIGAGREVDKLLNFQKTENPVMCFARRFFAEQAEKHEYIAHAELLVGQMRLRRTALTEQARAISPKHRIMVAQVITAQPAPAGRTRKSAKAQIAIGGARKAAAGDRQADRCAAHNGRCTAARRAVEALAAENNPHDAALFRQNTPIWPSHDKSCVK